VQFDSGNPPKSPAEKLIPIGRLTGAHGLKGALRLRLEGEDLEILRSLGRVFVNPGGAPREYRVLAIASLGRKSIRLQLEGVVTCEQAEALKGELVMAAESDLPPAAENEFYYYRAIGCDVALTDGCIIGKVEEIFSTGANDVLVVRGEGREVLVPVIADVVKAVDLDAGRITIEAVPGLLD
jgi:16S rRNA processing protein RimM